MQNGDIVRVSGKVIKSLENGRFLVQLRNGHQVVARVPLKRRPNVGVVPGGRVELSLSPADMSQGKIDKQI